MQNPQALYARWTAMWNGELHIADSILAPDFRVHLTADSTPPPAPVTDRESAKNWIRTIRAKADSLQYEVLLGPFQQDNMISAYWRVTALWGDKKSVKVGCDVLKLENGIITDCWTMNNNMPPES